MSVLLYHQLNKEADNFTKPNSNKPETRLQMPNSQLCILSILLKSEFLIQKHHQDYWKMKVYN